MAQTEVWSTTSQEGSANKQPFEFNSTPRKGAVRGFAAMDREKQRMIASKGGKMAHLAGRAHRFTPEEARVAGQKGGKIVSQDRDHMRAIGREGGIRRALHLVKETHPQGPTPVDDSNSVTKLAS